MKYTKTSVFLFPLLDIPISLFNKANGKSRLVNCFLYDQKIKHYRENHIFLVIDNYQDVQFSEFEKKLENHDNFITSYDILKGKYSIKVFSIPKDKIEDYKLFLEGKYSKISDASKSLILNCEFKSKGFLNMIFSKADEAKKAIEEVIGEKLPSDAEVYGIYNLNNEILNINRIDELSKMIKKKSIDENKEFDE